MENHCCDTQWLFVCNCRLPDCGYFMCFFCCPHNLVGTVVMSRWHFLVSFSQSYPISWPPIKHVIKTPLSQDNNNLPAESPELIQSGLAMLAMAKMSAARKRHPEITVSLSMSVDPGGVFLCLYLKGGGTFRRHWPKPLSPVPSSSKPALENSRWSWSGRFEPRSVRTSCLIPVGKISRLFSQISAFTTSPTAETCWPFSPAQQDRCLGSWAS